MFSYVRPGSKIRSLMHLVVAAPYFLSSTEVIGFEKIKDSYELCPNFGNIFTVIRYNLTYEVDDFLLQDGYLFRSRKLCIPCTFLREFLVWELHAGGLVGYFGRNKTIEVVVHRFYWPSLYIDVTRLVGQIAHVN